MLPLRQLFLSRHANRSIFSITCAVLLFYLWTISPSYVQSPNIEPPDPPEPPDIPKLIWYKLGPKGLTPDTQRWTRTCLAANPDHAAEFLTDDSADRYVQTAFGAARPDILKADLLRYLLLWDRGGVWFDLDVSCEEGIGIDEWIPPEYRRAAPGLVVGWEFDVGWAGGFVHQFATWAILARPRSPHMLAVVEEILVRLRETGEEHGVPVRNVTLAMAGDVVDFSGPRRMTFGIYRSLEKMLGRAVGPEEIQGIVRPVMVGDVLVMPGRSFAASSNRYRPEEEEMLPPQLVTHHYAGSWKNEHGGESV